ALRGDRGGPVSAVAGRTALVGGVARARRVVEARSRLACPVTDQQLLQDLGAGAGVVGRVPPELAAAEEPAPDARVDLHEPDIAGGRLEVRDRPASPDELPPAAFLPRRRLDQMMVELVEALLEGIGVEGALR